MPTFAEYAPFTLNRFDAFATVGTPLLKRYAEVFETRGGLVRIWRLCATLCDVVINAKAQEHDAAIPVETVRFNQWRQHMKKLIVATCAAALMTAVSFGTASAQTTGPSGGQEAGLKTNSPMDSQAKMKKKKKM